MKKSMCVILLSMLLFASCKPSSWEIYVQGIAQTVDSSGILMRGIQQYDSTCYVNDINDEETFTGWIAWYGGYLKTLSASDLARAEQECYMWQSNVRTFTVDYMTTQMGFPAKFLFPGKEINTVPLSWWKR